MAGSGNAAKKPVQIPKTKRTRGIATVVQFTPYDGQLIVGVGEGFNHVSNRFTVVYGRH
jgi:hypothetical protein